jgi:hypothetical protein
MIKLLSELGVRLGYSLSPSYVPLRVKGNYKGENGPSLVTIPMDMLNDGSESTAVQPQSNTIKLIPTCLEGMVLNIRPSTSNTEAPVGFIKSGEIIEVNRQVKSGFYELTDGKVRSSINYLYINIAMLFNKIEICSMTMLGLYFKEYNRSNVV